MAISRGQCPACRGFIPFDACSTPLGLGALRSLRTQGAPRARRPWALLYNAFGVSKSPGRRLRLLVLSRLVSIEHWEIRTNPLTEPEQLTQRESKRPFDGFVSNGLLRLIFVRSGIRKRFQVFPYDGYVHVFDNH